MAVVGVLPLHVAVGAAHPFEPAKAVVLQVIAVVMAVGWLVAQAAGRGDAASSRAPRRPPRWFTVPVAVLAATVVVSTALSLSFDGSLTGSAARAQGALTMLAVGVIAVLTADGLRHARQLDRLLTIMVMASVVVAGVVLFQRHGLDAVPVGDHRPGATFGNPLLAAGWLVVVLPVAVVRLIAVARPLWAAATAPRPRWEVVGVAIAVAGLAWWHLPRVALAAMVVLVGTWVAVPSRPSTHAWGIVAVHVVAAGMLLSALLATASRGPSLGVAVGASVAALAVAARNRRPRLLLAATAVAGVALAGVVFVGSSRSAQHPAERGVAGAVDVTDAATVAVRDRLWRAGATAVAERSPLWSPRGEDPHAAWRPLVGYGPDTGEAVLSRFAPADLWTLEGADVLPDRAHNVVLDSLLGLGVIGTVARVAIVIAAILVALSRMDVATDRRSQGVLVAVLLGGGVAGAVGAGALGGAGWAAPGGGIGLVVALASALLARSVRSRDWSPPPATVETIVAGGCLAAVVGHWVDAQASVDSVAGLVGFLVVVAILAGSWTEDRRRPVSLHRPLGGDAEKASWEAMAVLSGLIVGAAVHATSGGTTTAAAWVMITTVTVAVGLLVAATTDARPGFRRAGQTAAVTVGTAAAVVLPAAVIENLAGAESWTPLQVAAAGRVVVVVALLFSAGWLLINTPPERPRSERGRLRRVASVALAVTVALGGSAAVIEVGIRPAAADLLWGRARPLAGPLGTVEWLQQASRLHRSHQVRLALGSAALQSAVAFPRPQRDRLLHLAETSLLTAHHRDPFSSEKTAALADFHVAAGDLVDDEEEHLRHRRAAVGYADATARLRPGAAHIHALHALALVELAREQQAAAATRTQRRSDAALARAASRDPDLALISAVRALASTEWRATVRHASDAFALLDPRWDRRNRYGLLAASLSHRSLAAAQEAAERDGFEEIFRARLRSVATSAPGVDVQLAVARAASRAGDMSEAEAAAKRALGLVAAGDRTARAQIEATLMAVGERPAG